MSRPTVTQKRVLRQLVNYTCEVCHRHELQAGILQIHRINRGYLGGSYVPRNIQVICKDCHNKIHGREF